MSDLLERATDAMRQELAATVESTIEVGARIFQLEPWRMERILPGIMNMTVRDAFCRATRSARWNAHLVKTAHWAADSNRTLDLWQVRHVFAKKMLDQRQAQRRRLAA